MENKNIIGICPGYQGGHHIANIISTDQNYKSRIDENSYNLIRYNAHVNEGNFGRIHLDMFEHIENNLELYTHQNNVFHTHYGEFINFKLSPFYDLFPNKKFYLVEFPNNPKLDTFFRKRAKYHNDMAYYDSLHYYGEFKFHYKREIIEAIVGQDVLTITSDLIFTNDCRELIVEFNKGLDINLEYETVQPLHSKWFEKITLAVANIPEPPTETAIKVWYK